MIDIDGKDWKQLDDGEVMVRIPAGAWAMLLDKQADGDGWTGNIDYASAPDAWFETGQFDTRGNPIMEKRPIEQVVFNAAVRLLPKQAEVEPEGGTLGVFVDEKVGTKDKMA